MISELVKRDFKGKYRNSFLGYLWHIVNPLSMLVVYYVVFSSLFGRDIPDYWVYLSSAVFALNFFTSSLIGCSNAITGNSGMVNKIAFPREILVITNVLTNLITFVISYIILIAIIFISGRTFSISLLLLPVIIILMTFFSIGLGLIVSSLNVYYRDISNGMHIITFSIIFITPCFYRLQDVSNTVQTIVKFNPISYYTESLHQIMYYSTFPTTIELSVCFIGSIIMTFLGLLIFKKLERKFAEKL